MRHFLALLLLASTCFGAVDTEFRRQIQTTPFTRVFLTATNCAEALTLLCVSGSGTNLSVGGGGNFAAFDTIADMVAADPTTITNGIVMADGSVWQFDSDSVEATNSTIVASSFTGFESVGRWLKKNQENPIVVDTSGFITNYNVVTVRDRAQLKNVVVTNGIQLVYMRGVLNPGDKGEGFFFWDSDSVAAENGGIYVAPNNQSVPGNWKRVATPETVYTTWFDPVVTNGTLRLAIDFASTSSKGTVILPGGDTILDFTDPVALRSRVTVMGQTGTRIIASDSPATNYAAFSFSGIEGASLQNMTIAGWANAPAGNTNNTGYAVTMANVTNCILGGNVYQDFYTRPLNISGVHTGCQFYDEKWTRNSVKGYGAIGDFVHNDTKAFEYADQNGSDSSSEDVFIPNGIYALNFTNKCPNKRWIGTAHFTGLSQGINYTNCIVPWSQTLPAWQVGDGTKQMESVSMEHIAFNATGPNGTGDYGLLIRSSYEGYYSWISVIGFNNSGLYINPGATYACENNHFYGLIAQGAGTQYLAAVRMDNGGSDATGNFFTQCRISGTAYGHAIWLDNAPFNISDSYLQFDSSGHGIMLTNGSKVYWSGDCKVDSSATGPVFRLTFTGVPANNDTVSIAAGVTNQTKTWKTVVTDGSTQIPIGGTAAECATNLYSYASYYIFTNGPFNVTMPSSTAVQFTGMAGSTSTGARSGTYATVLNTTGIAPFDAIEIAGAVYNAYGGNSIKGRATYNDNAIILYTGDGTREKAVTYHDSQEFLLSPQVRGGIYFNDGTQTNRDIGIANSDLSIYRSGAGLWIDATNTAGNRVNIRGTASTRVWGDTEFRTSQVYAVQGYYLTDNAQYYGAKDTNGTIQQLLSLGANNYLTLGATTNINMRYETQDGQHEFRMHNSVWDKFGTNEVYFKVGTNTIRYTAADFVVGTNIVTHLNASLLIQNGNGQLDNNKSWFWLDHLGSSGGAITLDTSDRLNISATTANIIRLFGDTTILTNLTVTGSIAAGDTVTAVNDVFADSHLYSKVGSSSAYASSLGTLDVTATTIATAGTGSDEVFVTKTLLANSLAASGERVKMRASGTFAANANNKQIKLTFGSATIFDTTALAMNGGSWVVDAEVIRTGAAAEIYNVRWTSGNSTLPVTASVGNATVGLTTNIALRVLGNAAASDIIFKTLTDEYAKP